LSEQCWSLVYVPSKDEILTLATVTSDMETKPAMLRRVSIENKLLAKKDAPAAPPSRFPWGEKISQTLLDGESHC
jgi:hypothetical protein